MQGPSATESVRLGRTRSQEPYRILRGFFEAELQIPQDEPILFTGNVRERTITFHREGVKRPITKSFAKWPDDVQQIISRDWSTPLLSDEKRKAEAEDKAISDRLNELRKNLRQKMKLLKTSKKRVEARELNQRGPQLRSRNQGLDYSLNTSRSSRNVSGAVAPEVASAFPNLRLQSGPYPKSKGQHKARSGR